MTISEKTTHIAEAQANFVEQFKGKTNLDYLIEAWVTQIQELEAAAFEVLEDTWLSSAVGTQLDNIGTVLDEERGGKSDADYRVALSAIIKVRNSDGTAEDIIDLINGATGESQTIILEDSYMAAIEIVVDTPITNGEEVSSYVDRAKAAAVAAWFAWFAAALGAEFRFGVAGQGFDQGELAASVVL